jgi:hypothetical protein
VSIAHSFDSRRVERVERSEDEECRNRCTAESEVSRVVHIECETWEAIRWCEVGRGTSSAPNQLGKHYFMMTVVRLLQAQVVDVMRAGHKLASRRGTGNRSFTAGQMDNGSCFTCSKNKEINKEHIIVDWCDKSDLDFSKLGVAQSS